MKAAARDSLRMRTMLAEVGVFLDDNRALLPMDKSALAAAPVDRELVREILVTAGAPEHHIEWLTESCPSIAAALTYHAPRSA